MVSFIIIVLGFIKETLCFIKETLNFRRICRQNLDQMRYKTKWIEAGEIDIDLIPSTAFSYVLRDPETKSTGPGSR